MSIPKSRRVRFVHRMRQGPSGFISDDALRQRVTVIGRTQFDVIATDEAWFEVSVGEAWIAAFRILPQSGHPVIGEVRVFPREDHEGRHAGEWSGGVLGLRATVPAGGITTRLLRRLHTSDTAGTDFAEGIEEWKRFCGLVPGAKRLYRRVGFRTVRKPHVGGRRGWTGEELLRAAVFYVEIGGRRPVAELAKRWKLKPSQARDLLQAAQQKGLLTRGRPGVASRALTDHARELLAISGMKGRQ